MADIYELNDTEIDAVAGGAVGAGGLVAVAVGIANTLNNVSVLNGNKVSVLDGSLNGNKTNVGAGVLVNLLGGPSAIGIPQTV